MWRLRIQTGFGVLLFVVAFSSKLVADNYWIGPDGGDWFQPTFWTQGVPDSSDIVRVENGTSPTIAYGAAYASQVYIGAGFNAEGGLNLLGGSLDAIARLQIGGGARGSLVLDESCNVVTNDLVFEKDSNFAAAAGSRIVLAGEHLGNIQVRPDHGDVSAGLANLTLELRDVVINFRFPSNDLGPTLEGFENNLAINTLVVDASLMGLSGSSAMYASHLVVRAGSTVVLEGVNLYYIDGSFDPSLDVRSTSGALVRVVSEPSSSILAMFAQIGLIAFAFAARHFREGRSHARGGPLSPSAKPARGSAPSDARAGLSSEPVSRLGFGASVLSCHTQPEHVPTSTPRSLFPRSTPQYTRAK